MLKFEGNINESTISAALNFFRRGNYHGCVVIKKGEASQGVMYVNGPAIVYVNVSPRQRRLGNLLIRKKLLTPGKMTKIADQMKAENYARSFAALVLEEGWINEDVLLENIREMMLEIVLNVMNWQEGYFKFIEGRNVPKQFLPCPLAIDDIMREWFAKDGQISPFGESDLESGVEAGLTDEMTFHQAELRTLDILTPRQIEFGSGHKEKLQGIFQSLAEAAARQMSPTLGEKHIIHLSSIYEMSYNQFLTIVASDHLHTLVELKPFVDFGLISFHPETVAITLEQLLGATTPGSSSFDEFSQIEEGLIESIVAKLAMAFSPVCLASLNFTVSPYTRYRVDHHQHFSASLDLMVVGNFDWVIQSRAAKAYFCLPRWVFDVIL